MGKLLELDHGWFPPLCFLCFFWNSFYSNINLLDAFLFFFSPISLLSSSCLLSPSLLSLTLIFWAISSTSYSNLLIEILFAAMIYIFLNSKRLFWFLLKIFPDFIHGSLNSPCFLQVAFPTLCSVSSFLFHLRAFPQTPGNTRLSAQIPKIVGCC